MTRLRRPRSFLSTALLTLAAASALLLAAAPAGADGIPLVGKVTDEESRPLAGATVEARPVESAWEEGRRELAGEATEPVAAAACGDDGIYRLEVPGDGFWAVSFRHQGHVEHLWVEGPVEGPDALGDAVLTAAERVEVKVLDEAGEPVAGARVAAMADGGALARRRGPFGGVLTRTPRKLARTGDDGTAVLHRRDGETLSVVAHAPGHAPASLREAAGDALTLRPAAGRPLVVEVLDADGEPVADALVRTAASPHLPLGLTGDDGRLSLRHDSGEELVVEAWSRDDRRRVGAVEPAAGRAAGEADPPVRSVTLRLPAAGRLAGRVVTEDERTPVAGAWVWRQGLAHAAVRSDGRGGFELPLGSPSGGGRDAWGRVGADAAGHVGRSSRVRDDQVSGEAPFTLLLARAASARGRVVDAAGAPVAGAEVWSDARDGARFRSGSSLGDEAFTATDGSFHLAELAADTGFVVHALRDGFAEGSQELPALAPGEERGGLEIVLPAATTAFGRVVDLDERPVAGAEVVLRPMASGGDVFHLMRAQRGDADRAEATTDADGRFEIGGLATGRYVLSAGAGGHAPLTVPGVELPDAGARTDLGTLALEPGVTLTGRVVDPQERPVEGARVVATASAGLLSWRRPGRGDDEEAEVTGPDGRFSVRDLAPGVTVAVHARRDGYLPASLDGIEVPPEEPLLIEMEPAARLSGVVVDETGAPVEAAAVHVRGDLAAGGMTAASGHAESDEDGRFEVEGSPSGRVTLTVSAEGFLAFESQLDLAPGESREDLRFALEPGATVTGRVLDAAGDPVARAAVRVSRDQEIFSFRSFPSTGTDADGNYRLDGVAPGERSFIVDHEDHVRAVRDLTVVAGDNRLDFRLEPGLIVSGRVVDEAGAPVAGAGVGLGRGGEPAFRGFGGEQTDADGTFRLTGVEPGSYRLTASKQGYAATALDEPVEVAAAPVAGLELVLRRGARVTGRLLGADLSELAGAQVVAGDFGDQTRMPLMAPVDYEGRYSLEGVGPGEWTVMAMLSSGLPAAQERITIDPGESELVVDLDLSAGKAVLRGRVLIGDQPMSEGVVSLAGRDTAAVGFGRTDHRGRFEIRALEPGTYELEVGSIRGGMQHHTETVEVEGDTEVEVVLAASPLSGRVVDDGGAPVEGADVRLEPVGGGTGMTLPTRSAADGGFHFQSASPGSYRLRATADGYAPGETVVEVAEGEPLSGVEVRLEAASGLVLRVTDTYGRAPERVRVAALEPAVAAAPVPTEGEEDDGGPPAVFDGRPTPGEGGRVRLEGMPAGRWTLLVGGPGLATVRHEVTSPGPEVAVTLPPGHTLSVRVPALEQRGKAGRVHLVGDDGRRFLATGWLGGPQGNWALYAGRGRVPGLPAGRWTVTATTPDGRTWTGTAITAGGAETEVVLD